MPLLAVALAAVALAVAADAPPAPWGERPPPPLPLPAASIPPVVHAQQPGDAAAPRAAGVTSDMKSRVYHLGERIEIDVGFDGRVAVNLDAPPYLVVGLDGGVNRTARYVSGNGTAELTFAYTVQAGDVSPDLDYNGTNSLRGYVAGAGGGAANTTLPRPGDPGSLAASGDIPVDYAAPRLFAADTVRYEHSWQRGFGQIGGFEELDIFRMENRTYAVAASAHGLHLIRVHEGGRLSSAGAARDGAPGFDTLHDSRGVSAFALNGSAYVLGTSYAEHAVNLIRVHGNGTLSLVDSLVDNGNLTLYKANRVAAFPLAGEQHALVTSRGEHGVQLIRVHGNGTLEARGSLDHYDNNTMLQDAYDVAAFDLNRVPHALVTAWAGSSVQLIRVHDNGTLEARGSIVDGSNSDGDSDGLEFHVALGIAAFDLDGRPHALVVGGGDHGVQLIRVHDNGTLEARGSLAEVSTHTDESLELFSPFGVDAFSGASGGTYAAIAARGDRGIQLVYAREDGLLFPAGLAKEEAGFPGLNAPVEAGVFALGGGTYALAVAWTSNGGLQLMRLSPASAVDATSAAADGAYGTGSEVRIAVRFDASVRATGPPPELRLGSGGTASYLSGNNSNTLVFNYTVGPGEHAADLDYAGAGALSREGGGDGAITDTATGLQANRTLPPPGTGRSLGDLKDIAVDGGVPPVVSISSAAAGGTYTSAGDVINVTVAFAAPVRVAGQLYLSLNSGGAAAYHSGNNTAELVFRYAVGQGDSAAGLDYAGINTISGSGTIEDADTGLPAGRALPPPGSGNTLGDLGITVDARGPSVASVAASADGAYGAGRTITVTVAFDEPVEYSGAKPVLSLNVSGQPRAAAYASGNGTTGLVFEYTTRAGDRADDLGYNGTGALAGNVTDLAGHPIPALPRPGSPGSLSHTSDVLVDPAVPLAIAAGSARDGAGGGFEALSGSLDVDTVRVGGRTYAAVASHNDHAVQLVRVHENGTLRAAGEARHGRDGFDRLSWAYGIDAFRMNNGSAYAIVASEASGGVQLVRIREDGTMRAVDSLGDNATLELGGARRVAAFGMGGLQHALVSASADNGVQLIRIHDNGTLEARGSLGKNSTHNAGLELLGAHGVAAFSLGGLPHALVAGHADDGVQLIRIHDNGTLEARKSLADDGDGGDLELLGPRDIAAFNLSGRGTHALVASEDDDGVQLIRIHDNGTLEARGSAADGDRGFDKLDGAFGAAAFELGGSVYAAAASRWDDGVQLIRVRASDGALLAAGLAANSAPGFDGLDGAFAAHAFDLGGRPHAIVASAEGGAVQLIELSPVAVANVTSAAGGGPHAEGAEINVSVAFDRPVLAAAPLELRLNSGGSAGYLSGNGTAELVFRYAVGPGESAADLDYAGVNALSGSGTIEDATTGLPAGRALPPPGSGSTLADLADIAVDARAPSVASVAASADGAYGAGRTIAVTVAFDEPVEYSGAKPVLTLSVGGQPRAAAYASGNGTTGLVFEYATRADDRADDLGYNGTGALAGNVTDLVGLQIPKLPSPGSPGSLSHTSNVQIDPAVPKLIVAGSARHGADFGALSWSLDVDTIVVGGRTYAAVASHGAHAVQLIRVHENGTLRAADEAFDNNFDLLRRAEGIDAFRMGAAAYAIAAAPADDGVQLIQIHENGTLQARGSLADDGVLGGDIRLDGASRAAAFNMSGHAHALAAGTADNGVQLIRIHANGTLQARGSLAGDGVLGGDIRLDGAYGAAVFSLGGAPHALVSGHADDGVQLIRIHANGTLQARGSLADDGDGGDLELLGPRDIAAFNLSGRGTHALVASETDNGVQLIRIHENGTLEPRGSAAHGSRGFDRLYDVYGVAVFELGGGGGAYAAVASREEGGNTNTGGVQLIRIRASDGALLAAGSAVNDADGFDGLRGARGIHAFSLDGRPHLIVASAEGSAVQLIELSPVAVANVTSAAGGGPHAEGAEINVSVAFDRPVLAEGPLELRLNSGGSAGYLSGSGSAELVFRYAVGPGEQAADLDYAGINALSGSGTIADATTGLPAGRALPPPGSGSTLGDLADIAVETTRPFVSSVDASADGAYGAGRTIAVTVEFSERVEYSGAKPVLSLNVGGQPRAAAYASGDGTTGLVFEYATRAGDRTDDLGYRGTDALAGSAADPAGNPAYLALPRPGSPGSLSHRSDVLIDPAVPLPFAAGSAHYTEDGFEALTYSLDVDTVRAGNRTYAAVASLANAVQLIRVHENGTLKAEGVARNGHDGFDRLDGAYGIDAFRMNNGSAYAIVASQGGSGGVQLVRIHEDGTMRAADSLVDNGTLKLKGAQRVAAFGMGGHAHALVAAPADDGNVVGGVQLVRIHDNGTLEARGSMADDGPGGDIRLRGAYGVAAFSLGGHAHALVGGHGDNGVQLIRIHENGTLEARKSLADDASLELLGPRDIAAFNLSGRGTHALVASEGDNGVQLIRIHENGTLEPRGSAAHGSRGFDRLYDVYGAAAFELGGSAYAAVTSRDEHNEGGGGGIQLVRVREDSALLPAGSAANSAPGFGRLRGAFAAHAFDLGGRPHAIVASAEGSAVQLIELSRASVTGVASAAGEGPHTAGAKIDVAVAFDRPVLAAAPLELRLNSGSSAPYHSGSNTTELVFRYTVGQGDQATDLDYAGAHALQAGPGGAITEADDGRRHRHADTTLPRPGSGMSLGDLYAIRVDGMAPSAVSVSSADGTYGEGGRVAIAVEFDEAVLVRGAPALELNASVAGGAAPAQALYESGSGTASLEFLYEVRQGDSADRLDYTGTSALDLRGGAIADMAGNAANLSLPEPGSAGSLGDLSAIKVDGIAPSVVSVSSADGTYGEGGRVAIAVEFDEAVLVRGAPALELDASVAGGAAPAQALYESGSGTASLEFLYEVRQGDSADRLDYTGTSALDLRGGAIEDMAGNAADLSLPEPGSAGSLGGTSSVSVRGSSPGPGPGPGPANRTAYATADAVFAGSNTVRIAYSAPLGAPAAGAGPVYGAITLAGGGDGGGGAAVRHAGSVTGLGTAVHTVRFGGGGAALDQTGTIALEADLEHTAENGTRYEFTEDVIAVRAGASVRTATPAGQMPVVAIERDSFVRVVDVTGGGDSVRPALNVSGLAADAASPTPPAPAQGAGGMTVTFPGAGGSISVIAPFASVSFPPGVTAVSVPPDGLLVLHVSGSAPPPGRVAAALGVDASYVDVRRVVEVGDDAMHVVFDMPVRILLEGQAGGRAFYVNNTSGEVVPIRTACAADDTAAVHAQLAGEGECWLDRDGDKVVYTYHLTRFGTAAAPTALEVMVAEAAAGGTVRVPAGTYAEDVLVINKSLTIEPADPADPPVLTGYSRIAVASPPQASEGAGGGGEGGPVVIRGLVFKDTTRAPGGGAGADGMASITVEPPAPGAPPGAAAMPVTIEGNTFRNTCDAAVRAAGASASAAGAQPPIAGLTVKDNRFYDIGGNRANCGAGGGEPAVAAANLADAIVAGRYAAGGAPAAAGPAQLAGMAVQDNYIFGTTYTGIRIAGADGLLVKGNHIEGVPDDGVRIMQSRNVQVHLNTIVGANQAPRSPAASAAEAPHDGLAGAAIEVWSGSDGVDVTLNRISESAGALLVCAGTCDPGPDAANGTGGGGAVPVPAVPANATGGSATDGIRFSHNVLAESNTGVLVANAAGGELDARANYYPGYADSAAGRASPAGAVLLEPALGYAGPVRIGAVVADGPSSAIRSVDAAVRAAFELGVFDFNAAQARDGGTVGLEPAVRAVDSPDYTAAARSAHASAVSALRSGSSADVRMLPVLHNSISSAMALYDASSSGAAGLAAISAMGAPHAHYPFVLDRGSGAIVAHGADASLVGGYDNDGAGPSAADAAAAAGLLDFSPPVVAAAAGGTGVDPGHPGAPWKWRAHESVNPATNGSEPKRSVLALHPGPDGAAHTEDDLVFGAGYHPGPGAAHLVVAAGDAAAAAAETGAIVAISPASTASQLAARDALFRLAPPDAKLAGVVVAQALADRQGAAAAAQPITIVALNDSASLQSASLAGELYEIDLQGALPDGADRVAVVSYNSSSPTPPASGGGGWASAAADLIRAAASESRGDAAVVYSGRAGAFAALAEALGGQPPPNTRWYSTGELARAELAASGPDAASLARAGQLAAVLQRAAAPNAEIDAALAAPGIGVVLDESTRGPAYAAYDAAALLGRAMALTPGVPGAPAAVARAIDEDVARTHAGALGSPLILDRNGDLVLPIAYTVSAFPAADDPGGAWGQLDTLIGERSCGIALAKGALDFGILSLGRYSRPDTQTVINTGTLPYRSVTLDPGDWTYASGQTLPASITELRELGRAAAYAGAASGFVVAPGLEPGQDRNVQFRINLTAYQSLPPGEASQTINYLVECRAAAS